MPPRAESGAPPGATWDFDAETTLPRLLARNAEVFS